MIGSIARQSLSVILIVAGGVGTPKDSTRKIVGYAGVLPIPESVASSSASLRPDFLMERRDTRADRGRVLYAAGHVHRCTDSTRTAHAKRPESPTVNPRQALVQSRATTLPNS